jgi:hypothetical protein
MRSRALLLLIPLAGLSAGCGGSKHNTAAPSTTSALPTTTVKTPTAPPVATTAPAPTPPLQGEAATAATGDIPDNQVFLVFRDAAAGYSIKYPEGWAQQGSGRRVTFRDKNNIVRILIGQRAVPTQASAGRELASLPGVTITSPPRAMTISGKPAIKVVYTTQSSPNAVTGKRVVLAVDRYYLAHGGTNAVIDLGTPKGVDNVDAYRLMVESFRWR